MQAIDPIEAAPAPPERRSGGGRGRLVSVLRLLGHLVASVIVLVTATFLMVQLVPGDPVIAALGEQASPELVAERRAALGLDLPIHEQLIRYWGNLLRGDLGTSIVSHQDISFVLGSRIVATLSIAIPAFAITLLLAIPLGMVVAVLTQNTRRRRVRNFFISITSLFNSVPEFVMAVSLSAIFAVILGLLPVAGRTGFTSYVLPVLALVIGPTATLSRIVRVETSKVLDSDYMLAAKARRLPRGRLYLRHMAPNALTATLTYAGLLLGSLIAGAVLVENVFAWPGVGTMIPDAVSQKDYPAVQSALLVLGLAVIAINMIVDVVLSIVDPQSRLGSA